MQHVETIDFDVVCPLLNQARYSLLRDVEDRISEFMHQLDEIVLLYFSFFKSHLSEGEISLVFCRAYGGKRGSKASRS